VLRTTLTRHGAGPLPSEDAELTRALPEPHNDASGWQGRFRVGWPDPILTRHAITACGGLDALALTHLDRVEGSRFRFVEAHRVDDAEHGALPRSSDPDPLVAQERLTRWLMRARPVLAELGAPTSDAFVAWIERTYALPVSIASHGPTHVDKRLTLALA
jgi:adenylosuccinate synthase